MNQTRWMSHVRMFVAVVALAGSHCLCFAQDQSTPEALAVYQDAANFQNNGAYDLAETEWMKFLKDHGKDPLAAKAQQYLGVCQLQLKKFDKSAESFAAVIKNYPKFEMLEEAHLNLAWSQYSMAQAQVKGMHEAAAASFATLLKNYPMGKFVDQGLYYQGESLYALGQKDKAVASYDQLVKNHPKSALRADGLYALGVTQEELGQYPAAGQAYDLFLKEFDKNPLVTEVRMRKAETILQAGDFATAEKQFGEVAAVAGFAAADHAMFRRGYCLGKLEKFDEAAVAYAKIAEINAKSVHLPEAAISAGRCYYRADKIEEAAKWLDYVIKSDEKNAPEAAHWLCRIFIRTKKYGETATLAAEAIKKAPETPFLVNLKMDWADGLYDLEGRRAEAMGFYAKIAEEHAKHELAPQALYNAAFTALDIKKYEDGVKYADSFVKQFAQDKLLADVKYVAAECQLQLQKYPEAEVGFRDLATNHIQHADIDTWRVRLGLALYLQKKYPEVVTNMTALIPAIKPADLLAEAHFLSGMSLFYTDKFDDAGKAYVASLAANPKWRQADETLLFLSRVERKQEKLTEAKATATKLLTEFPQSALADQAHYRLGEYHFAGNDFANALAEYEIVITKTPTSAFVPYSIYGKAWSLFKTQKYPEATAAFTELLTKHPQHQLQADALYGRALSRRYGNEFQGAADDLEAFLKSMPPPEREADALYERGMAEVGLKKYDVAVATFTSLLTKAPKFPATDKVLYELGWALKSQEKHKEATPHFAKLAATFPDSPLAAEANFHVGEDFYDAKTFEEAVKSYAVSKQKAGKTELGEKATYKLGWSYYQLKQFDKAVAEFNAQVTEHPKGPLAGDAMFMKAEGLFKLENYKEAWPVYLHCTQTMPASETIAVLIWLHGGQTASNLKQWNDAIGMLAQIPAKHQATPFMAETLYELGWAYQNANKIDDSLKNYEAAALKSRDYIGARARFMMGEIYFGKKQHTDAIREFQRSMYGFGGEAATEETKKWQAKSGFEAGRCAEVLIEPEKDPAKRAQWIADAKKYYTFVAEKHAKDALAATAKERLAALEKVK